MPTSLVLFLTTMTNLKAWWYFQWLCKSVSNTPKTGHEAFNKLLAQLFDRSFTATYSPDIDRIMDGLQLRIIFAEETNVDPRELNEELQYCSVLEVMVALAKRCEASIMSNYSVGDRTGQWFWGMVASLGLGRMNDLDYDPQFVDTQLTRLIKREYQPNGEGGLFTVFSTNDDMRTLSIWTQLNLYLNELLVDEGVLERRNNYG